MSLIFAWITSLICDSVWQFLSRLELVSLPLYYIYKFCFFVEILNHIHLNYLLFYSSFFALILPENTFVLTLTHLSYFSLQRLLQNQRQRERKRGRDHRPSCIGIRRTGAYSINIYISVNFGLGIMAKF